MINTGILSLHLSRLCGDVVGLSDGFADAMGTTNSVDASSSLSFSYNASGKFYEPVGNSPSLIPGSIGSEIGDMTGSAGRAAAFDGVVGVANAQCAERAASSGYIGKNYGAFPKKVAKVSLYGSTNVGFFAGGDNIVTMTLRGKNGAAPIPYANDGTVIGSASFTDSTSFGTSPVEITSSDALTEWQFLWVEMSMPGGIYCRLGEMMIYAPGSISNMVIVSDLFPVSPQPEQAIVSVELDEREAMTPGIDFLFEVSRDAGVTWTAASLDLKIIRGTVRHYGAEVDLSSQPAGSSMKWRFRTTSGKNVAICGVVVRFPGD